MRGYSTRDVSELVGLSAGKVRALARAGLLSPQRNLRRRYRFSFQDIILLRTAKELMGAHIHPRKVWRALRSLKRQLPQGQPLTALRVSAEGDQVVVRDKDAVWHPESGQATFDFSVSELAARAVPLVREAAREAQRSGGAGSEDWYALGLEYEAIAAFAEAQEAYRQATALDAQHVDAHINLGRLLHAEGRVAAAERHYRQALAAAPDNATAQFNLGVALEDLGRNEEAIKAYRQTLALDPAFADAHYNLAHLYERRGEKPAAIRHLARYKRLSATPLPPTPSHKGRG